MDQAAWNRPTRPVEDLGQCAGRLAQMGRVFVVTMIVASPRAVVSTWLCGDDSHSVAEVRKVKALGAILKYSTNNVDWRARCEGRKQVMAMA